MKNEFEDLVDQAILATGYNLVLSGKSEKEAIEVLIGLGWDRDKAEFVIKHISRSLPAPKNNTWPSLLLTVIFFSVIFFFWGEEFVPMPGAPLWRVLSSIGYAFIPQLFFLLIWGAIYGAMGGGQQD